MRFELNHLIEDILAGVKKIAAIALFTDTAAIPFDQRDGALEISLRLLGVPNACITGGPRPKHFEQRQGLLFTVFGEALRFSVTRLSLLKLALLSRNVSGAQQDERLRVGPLTLRNLSERGHRLLHR